MSSVQKNDENKIEKNKKKSVGLKILLLFLFILLAGTIIAGGYLIGLYNKVDNVKLDKTDFGIATDEIEQYPNAKKIKNIALFGVDATDSETGRSDSIMVATVDPVHNKLKITSFMRDSYVNIPGIGNDKLNHAYAFGGPQLAIKTLNENFGLNIEDFATVNFSSLPIVIDILGGIELNITVEELEYINGYIDDINSKDGTNAGHITYAGPQHVNGVQALAYSRIRYTSGGDYERTQRHRTVLTALFDKLSNTSASAYTSLLNEMLPHVQTSLSATDILGLGTKVLGIGNNLEQERFPRDGFAEGTNIDGVYYLSFDKEATINQVREYIFEDKK